MIKKIWSINEWGRLHELIVGSPASGHIPDMRDLSQQSFDRVTHSEFNAIAPSSLFPEHVIEQTHEDLVGFKTAIMDAGVCVHDAKTIDLSKPVTSPYWQADQETAINIRDLTLIHGDLTIDSPSPTRGRYFESFTTRDLIHQYYKNIAYKGYFSPPRPQLFDATYDLTRERGINETEPLFDAANCMRFGQDIVIDINNTANQLGAVWLQSALNTYHGDGKVTVHPVNYSPDHIDVVMLPLCEGVVLINTQYVNKDTLPSFLKNWTVIEAPELPKQSYYTGTPKASDDIGLNVLILDGEEKTLFVEKNQLPLIRSLEQQGFRPIPIQWRHGRSWGGGFHCITLDVHRDGVL